MLFRSTAHAGQQLVEGPGKIVVTVVLHGQPGVEEVEQGLAEWVAAHQVSTDQGQDEQGDELSWAGILGSQGKGSLVLVVNIVDPSIQPGYSRDQKTGSGTVPVLISSKLMSANKYFWMLFFEVNVFWV